MNSPLISSMDDEWIIKKRGEKNNVNPAIPYAYLIEKEFMHTGLVEDVITIFLTNRECPFKCLMCDLWKNTTEQPVPVGSIPGQIKYALKRLPKAKHLKLYNSGNFFDRKAIPRDDYEAIAELVEGFETLIVECHPKLIDQQVIEFSRLIQPDLQIALGLETVHPEILPILNKRMSLEEFSQAVHFLNSEDILVRTFILFGLPFLSGNESIKWAKTSLDFAFSKGVECCAIIPTRSGNGTIDYLEDNGYFHKPDIHGLVEVVEYGLKLGKGRVFADTWDLERFVVDKGQLKSINSHIQHLNFTQQS